MSMSAGDHNKWLATQMSVPEVFAKIKRLHTLVSRPELFAQVERDLLYDVLSAIATDPTHAQALASAAKNAKYSHVETLKNKKPGPRKKRTKT
jgi:hypothetical protein